MTEIQEKVLLLLYKGELSAKEICQRLDIPPDLNHAPTNGEFCVKLKDEIEYLQEDNLIDELIEIRNPVRDDPNQDIFCLTSKGKKYVSSKLL